MQHHQEDPDDEVWSSTFVEDNEDNTDHEADSPASEQDRAQLEHKLRSAEGRYRKSEQKLQEFEHSIADMRQQLSAMTAPVNPEPEPENDPPLMPDGWSAEEWQDYKDDQPVTAEIQEQQIRKVQQLTDKIDTYQQDVEQHEQHRRFRDTVLTAHPDFDDLLASQKDDIEHFIKIQENPLLRQAYQQVYDAGTAEQVVQLLTDYKHQQEAPKGQTLSARAQQALAVAGHNSQPALTHSGRVNPDDFDAAWAEFANVDD